MSVKNKKINAFSKLNYGIGNTGYSVISQTMNNFVMYFGSAALGMPGTLVSIAIALSTLWDAITDPIVGDLSDKQKSKKFGKRHGYMIVGCVGMIIFNIALWSVPVGLPVAIKFIWLLLAMVLLETFNTIFITPYTALGTELSNDYNERTSIQSYKTVFFLIGMVIPTLLASLFMTDSTGGYENAGSYVSMAICTSVICLICGFASILGTKKYIPMLNKRAEKEKPRPAERLVFSQFFAVFKKQNFRAVIIGYASSLISAAFLTGVGLHVFTYTFHMGAMQKTILLGVLIVSAIISQPFWYQLSKKIGKVKSLIIALFVSLTGVLAVLIWFIFRHSIGNVTMFWLLISSILFSGFGTGALYSLPISMYADLIGQERKREGVDKSGTYNAFLTFAYKISNAIALVVIGVVLDLIGFVAKDEAGNDILTQPEAVQIGLGLLLIIGIIGSLVFSVCFYSRFKLEKQDIISDDDDDNDTSENKSVEVSLVKQDKINLDNQENKFQTIKVVTKKKNKGKH